MQTLFTISTRSFTECMEQREGGGIKLQLNMNYTILCERWDPPATTDLVERAQRIWDPAGDLGLQTGGPWFVLQGWQQSQSFRGQVHQKVQ
jgi:hypothetical protein